MNMCQKHWDQLREAITKRGLSALVSDTGEQVAQKMQRELNEGQTVDSYDPLMAAFLAIGNNGMQFIQQAGGNPLALMMDDPNRPFEKCTICYLNWITEQHRKECQDPNCEPPNGPTWEWMIDRAADDQIEVWKNMRSDQ